MEPFPNRPEIVVGNEAPAPACVVGRRDRFVDESSLDLEAIGTGDSPYDREPLARLLQAVGTHAQPGRAGAAAMLELWPELRTPRRLGERSHDARDALRASCFNPGLRRRIQRIGHGLAHSLRINEGSAWVWAVHLAQQRSLCGELARLDDPYFDDACVDETPVSEEIDESADDETRPAPAPFDPNRERSSILRRAGCLPAGLGLSIGDDRPGRCEPCCRPMSCVHCYARAAAKLPGRLRPVLDAAIGLATPVLLHSRRFMPARSLAYEVSEVLDETRAEMRDLLASVADPVEGSILAVRAEPQIRSSEVPESRIMIEARAVTLSLMPWSELHRLRIRLDSGARVWISWIDPAHPQAHRLLAVGGRGSHLAGSASTVALSVIQDRGRIDGLASLPGALVTDDLGAVACRLALKGRAAFEAFGDWRHRDPVAAQGVLRIATRAFAAGVARRCEIVPLAPGLPRRSLDRVWSIVKRRRELEEAGLRSAESTQDPE